MGKRFGRNQKRKLKEQIKALEEENIKVKKQRDSAGHFPYLKTESMSLAIMPDFYNSFDCSSPDAQVQEMRIQFDPMIIMFSRKFTMRDLEDLKRYPQDLSGEFSRMIEDELNRAIPQILNQIPRRVG